MKKILLMCSCLLVISCTNIEKDEKNKLPLYVKSQSVEKTNGELIKKDTILINNTDYIEFLTARIEGENDYFAGYISGNEFLTENTNFSINAVVKKDGSTFKFASNTDFLNFMSKRGYEMIDKIKLGVRTEYTFRKRKF